MEIMGRFSYWEESHYFNNPDVVIVGSGIVGLSTGISLLEKDPSLRVLILERSNIPYGASTRNAGFACFGSPSEIIEDLKHNNLKEVFDLFASRYHGIKALLNRLQGKNIGHEEYGGQEVFLDSNPVDEETLQKINSYIEDVIGIKNYFVLNPDKLIQSGLKNFKSLIFTPYESCINPMKIIDELSKLFLLKGGKILPNMRVDQWEDNGNQIQIQVNDGFKFYSKKLLFAINGFAHKFFPDLDIQPARNQVLLIQPENNLLLSGCYHFNKGYVYFRKVEQNLLIGGGRNIDLESENSDQMEVNQNIFNYLLTFAKHHILTGENFKIINHWVGILGLGSQKKPIIQKVSPNVGVALRLSGVGIAIGTLVGEKAADLILE